MCKMRMLNRSLDNILHSKEIKELYFMVIKRESVKVAYMEIQTL